MNTRKEKQHKVFVYGTLRQSKAATHRLYGYTMHLIRGGGFDFPAIQPSGNDNDVVLGNVLTVSDKQLKALDQYEGVDGGLYTREHVRVQAIGQQEDVVAFAYVGGASIFPPRIQGGDWHSR